MIREIIIERGPKYEVKHHIKIFIFFIYLSSVIALHFTHSFYLPFHRTNRQSRQCSSLRALTIIIMFRSAVCSTEKAEEAKLDKEGNGTWGSKGMVW